MKHSRSFTRVAALTTVGLLAQVTLLGSSGFAALSRLHHPAPASFAPAHRPRQRFSGCISSNLKVHVMSAGVAMGAVGAVVSLQNVSARSCDLQGFPILKMLGAENQLLVTETLHRTRFSNSSSKSSLVRLKHGSRAFFDVTYPDRTGYENSLCPTSTWVEVFVPGAVKPIKVPWRIQPFGGITISKLQCGQVSVSPFFEG